MNKGLEPSPWRKSKGNLGGRGVLLILLYQPHTINPKRDNPAEHISKEFTMPLLTQVTRKVSTSPRRLNVARSIQKEEAEIVQLLSEAQT
ncbi:hypothetical protein U1Q18_026705 [Sarracenia purpurea var. burkii]